MTCRAPTPTIIVSGLGRCGTTMMMQMLHVAGLSCAGEPPAFEDERINGDAMPTIGEFSRRAVKILDPHRIWWFDSVRELPDLRVIWMDRNPRQQARSQSKFMQHIMGVKVPYKRLPELETRLGRDRRECLARMEGLPLLVLAFEDVLARPAQAATSIAKFVFGESTVELVAKIGGVVHVRDHLCRPNMDVEAAMVLKHEGTLA